MSVLDTIRAATPTRKTVTMCLDGALQAEWDAAVEAVNEAARRDADNGSLAMTESAAAFEALDAISEKFDAAAVTFTFSADRLGWGEYLRLQADHAPREGNVLDRVRGFNMETFYPALIRATCISVASADGEPEPMPDDAWDLLLGADGKAGRLNLKQVNNLADGANWVMNGESAVPPSARSLLKSRDFGASLAQPSPGTSPPSGSEDGSRPTSPKSSTTKKARTKGSQPAT